MCTKEEVREVVMENSLPNWAKIIFSSVGIGFMMLMSWSLYTIHEQEGNTKDLKVEIIEKINGMNSTFILNNALIAGKIELLTTQLTNIKEIAIDRSDDRYTGKQAKSRSKLIDERCKTVTERIKRIEVLIEKHHTFSTDKH